MFDISNGEQRKRSQRVLLYWIRLSIVIDAYRALSTLLRTPSVPLPSQRAPPRETTNEESV